MASKDPFGGNLTRRTVIAPVEKEKTTSFGEKREELKKSVLDHVDREALENEGARIRNDTARLDAEYLELRSRLGQGQAIPGALNAPQHFTGTTKALYDIIQLGRETGINVIPLIQQVLTGQGALIPPAPAAQDVAGVPNWLGTTLGKIVEKSFDANTKPHEDAKIAVMEERLKNQELLINRELGDLKDMLKQRLGGEVKDPTQAAADSVKNLTLLIAAVKALSPEPVLAPPSGNSGELAFKYQDRQWGHEEAKLNAEIERQKIISNMQVETQKLEQNKNNIAQIPEMIGAVVAQSLIESGKNKGAAPAQTAGQLKQKVDTLKVFKSKNLPHGAITDKCPECQQDLSFVTSAKAVNCVSCGARFKIQLVETEGGPTGVETADQSPAAAPAPAEDKLASSSDDAYLFKRGA